jgi:hypothetical protein
VKKWLAAVASRCRALSQWASWVKGGNLLKQSLCLADIFDPMIFLNSFRQQTARMTKVPKQNSSVATPYSCNTKASVLVCYTPLLYAGSGG